jgi:hypothetical protein
MCVTLRDAVSGHDVAVCERVNCVWHCDSHGGTLVFQNQTPAVLQFIMGARRLDCIGVCRSALLHYNLVLLQRRCGTTCAFTPMSNGQVIVMGRSGATWASSTYFVAQTLLPSDVQLDTSALRLACAGHVVKLNRTWCEYRNGYRPAPLICGSVQRRIWPGCSD